MSWSCTADNKRSSMAVRHLRVSGYPRPILTLPKTIAYQGAVAGVGTRLRQCGTSGLLMDGPAVLQPRSKRSWPGGAKVKEHAMSHKLNSAVAEIGVEIGKDSFDVAGQDKRDEMHSEASSSSQPSIITRDQGRRGRPRVPSVTAIRKVCSIPEGDDKSGVVQCKISAEPVSVVGQERTSPVH